MKRIWLFLIILVLCVACFSDIGISSSDQGYQETWHEYNISIDKTDDEKPSIYENIVAWEGEKGICIFDTLSGTKKTIPRMGGRMEDPDIYGDIIVWADYRNGNWDIYMYNLSSNEDRQITKNASDQEHPSICGDIIVWQDSRGEKTNIWMYNISSGIERPVCPINMSQIMPRIHNNKIVWSEYDWHGKGYPNIVLYDLEKEDKIYVTNNSSIYQTSPTIFEDKIVWVDLRNGDSDAWVSWEVYPVKVNSDIYIYNITSKKEMIICNHPAGQWQPAIHGTKIIWADLRNDADGVDLGDGTDNVDIYLYDLKLKKEYQLTTNSKSQGEGGEQCTGRSIDIFGNMIVWEDERNMYWKDYGSFKFLTNTDIYLYTNESVNVPMQNQNGIRELLSQYRYILITSIVAVALLISFIYYKIKMRKLKHEK